MNFIFQTLHLSEHLPPEYDKSMKCVIILAGPTAVGKTVLAIEVAKHFNSVVLSADSRQCYKELNIGVARPSEEELNEVPHYFIASHSVQDGINAAWYETYALGLLQQLFAKHDKVVVTGGTGLYIKALTEGLDAIPDVEEIIRQEIINSYNAQGMGWLQQQLQVKDSLFASVGEMKNPQRMMRALEVVCGTGRSIISFRNNEKKPRPFRTVQIGLELPRPVLNERIDARVDMMMAAGLEVEVCGLLNCRNLGALQTVGYKELFDYFDGTTSLQAAVALIKQNTRRYAKRQMTWFKKQSGIRWINTQDTLAVMPAINKILLGQ